MASPEVARWNGQTKGAHAFSVAQHCVLVERLTADLNPRITREVRLMALLHDAPEYVVGDLISPFKDCDRCRVTKTFRS